MFWKIGKNLHFFISSKYLIISGLYFWQGFKIVECRLDDNTDEMLGLYLYQHKKPAMLLLSQQTQKLYIATTKTRV